MQALDRFCSTAHNHGFNLAISAVPGRIIAENADRRVEVQLIGNDLQLIAGFDAAMQQLFFNVPLTAND
jgi:hypothetical protein